MTSSKEKNDYYASMYKKWKPSIYWIDKNEIIIEFEKRNDEQSRATDPFDRWRDEVLQHEQFKEAIKDWTKEEEEEEEEEEDMEMSVEEWKEYEEQRMNNLLRIVLFLHGGSIELTTQYPGQLGLWCSTFVNAINEKFRQNKSQIVCVLDHTINPLILLN